MVETGHAAQTRGMLGLPRHHADSLGYSTGVRDRVGAGVRGPSLGWRVGSVYGGASREPGLWEGSCRNSGRTRSSLRRSPLWSWAPLLCTRFSSSTRPGEVGGAATESGGHTAKAPIPMLHHSAAFCEHSLLPPDDQYIPGLMAFSPSLSSGLSDATLDDPLPTSLISLTP